MKFDLFQICENPTGEASSDLGEVLDQIVLAEDLGFGSVWIAEHHGSRYGSVPNPAVLGAAIASRTSRIGIGAGVSVLPFHHPIRVAEDYALLDVISNGRLKFGCGRGYQPKEFAAFGVELTNSRDIFQESLDIIRGLWENETFSYRGKFYAFDDFALNPRPVQESVPIWMVASSTDSYPLAAANRVQILTQASVRQTVEELRENVATARAAYADLGFAPEDVDIVMNIPVHLEETTERAEAVARDRLAWQFQQMRALSPGADGSPIPKGYESYKKYGPVDTSPVEGGGNSAWSFSALNESKVVLVGTPDEAKSHLEVLKNDIGIDHVMCCMRFGGMDHEAVLRSLQLWSDEVMPAFADASVSA